MWPNDYILSHCKYMCAISCSLASSPSPSRPETLCRCKGTLPSLPRPPPMVGMVTTHLLSLEISCRKVHEVRYSAGFPAGLNFMEYQGE